MTKPMETLRGIIDFFSEYQTWAKITMFASLVVLFGTMILAKKKSSDIGEEFDVKSIVEKSKRANTLKAELLTKPEVVPSFIRSSTRHDEVRYFYDVELSQLKFDLLVYLYNNRINQQPHYIVLIDFDEPDAERVNWKRLSEKSDEFATKIDFEIVKSTLLSQRGFDAPLEFTSSELGFDPRQVYRPSIFYVQIAGRRENLTQADLMHMKSADPGDRAKRLFRITVSYDFLLDGFRPLL